MAPLLAAAFRLPLSEPARLHAMLGPMHHDPTDLIIHGNRQYFVDDVRHVVTWNGKNLIPHTHYRKLRFFLRKASIYSFQMWIPPRCRGSSSRRA